MNSRHPVRFTGFIRSLAAFSAGFFVSAGAHAFSYSFRDLGNPAPADHSLSPFSPRINNRGEVCFSSVGLYDYRAYLARGGTLQRVPTLSDGTGQPGRDNLAFDLSDDGQVVGYSRISDRSADTHAYLWRATGQPVDLSPVPGATSSRADRITNNGLVLIDGTHVYSVGSGTFASVASFLPPGATLLAVNDDGVFLSRVGNVLYTSRGGVHTELAGTFAGTLQAFNDRGEVLSSEGDELSLLRDGTTHALGSMPGLDGPLALGDGGTIVGTYFADVPLDPERFDDNPFRAFGSVRGKLIDLNTVVDAALGYTLVSATDINDRGQVTGVAYGADGRYRVYVLTPVPEPAAFGAGAALLLVALCLVRRRCRGAVPG